VIELDNLNLFLRFIKDIEHSGSIFSYLADNIISDLSILLFFEDESCLYGLHVEYSTEIALSFLVCCSVNQQRTLAVRFSSQNKEGKVVRILFVADNNHQVFTDFTVFYRAFDFEFAN
jgi:hypothetical protein